MKAFSYIFMVLCVILCVQAKLYGSNAPNIIFILTDDQDVEIGGMTPITKTRKLIGDAGIVFKNMFATSPLCCPSRSSILTGHYVHNQGALNNSISGNCSSPAWQKQEEIRAFSTYLKKQNYKTFFAGKYLNQYGFKNTGGVKHIPPGWDDWTGLVGNSQYYNFSLSVNGKEEKHGDTYPDDYLTDIVGRKAEDFLEKHSSMFSDPFFMMLSTPACHAPFTPAPQYKANFSNVAAPRNGSFNVHGADKHWLIRAAKHPLSNLSLNYIDNTYRDRWRTLLSVDDIVERLVNTLEKKKMLDNTYIVYTSDNGFHLGQFSLPNDKRQLYEFDVRVPLMVRGPGIKPGQVRNEIILNIDFAPTFVDLAGHEVPSHMDGRSFKPILLSNSSQVPEDKWRTDFMIEHLGEYNRDPACSKYINQQVANCQPDCVCEDAKNNTYQCVRSLARSLNFMYCEFADTESFVEVYNLTSDPHQLTNIASSVDPNLLLEQNHRMIELAVCYGRTCHSSVKPWPPALWDGPKSALTPTLVKENSAPLLSVQDVQSAREDLVLRFQYRKQRRQRVRQVLARYSAMRFQTEIIKTRLL